MPLAVRVLTVRHTVVGGQNLIEYRLDPATEPPRCVPIPPRPILDQKIGMLLNRIDGLVWEGELGHGIRQGSVEEPLQWLARTVLPPEGLHALLGPEVHPQLDASLGLPADIPWEMLEPPAPGSAWTPMTSHHVWPGPTEPSAGRDFLLVVDPTGDLGAGQPLARLADRIRRLGFDVRIRSGQNATVETVLRDLADPEVAGAFFHCHGRHQRDLGGYLVMSDGRIFAENIQDASPRARFVFLNACWSATREEPWDLERRMTSVAGAFASAGPGRVVVAPQFPVLGTHAAEAADAFFGRVAEGRSVGEAILDLRRESHARYCDGEPHTLWMAYCLLGDVNEKLPDPRGAEIGTGSRAVPAFDEAGQLRRASFSFPLQDVLLRAAKRKHIQGRSVVTTEDLVAGLVRKGSLTREGLRRAGVVPDDLYRAFTRKPRNGNGTVPASLPKDREEWEKLLAQWIVTHREQMDEDLVRTLEEAGSLASRGGRSRISERDALEVLCEAGLWPEELHERLPSARRLREHLREIEEAGEVDENGTIVLADLAPRARRIVEVAHMLGQKCGAFPIGHRTLLAAFLASSRGHAARACRHLELRPRRILAILILASQGKEPRSYGLGREAAEGVLLNVLDEARSRRLEPERPIEEEDLFRAFCRRASPSFARWVRQKPLGVELARLATVDPPPPEESAADPESVRLQGVLETVDEALRPVFEEAAELAARQGWRSIRSPHLFAALVGDGTGNAGQALSRAGLSPLEVRKQAEACARRGPDRGATPADAGVSLATRGILLKALELAWGEGRGRPREGDLVRAFLAAREGVVAQLLGRLGHTRHDRAGDEEEDHT